MTWLKWMGGEPAWVAHCWIFMLVADERDQSYAIYTSRTNTKVASSAEPEDVVAAGTSRFEVGMSAREKAEWVLKDMLTKALGDLQP